MRVSVADKPKIKNIYIGKQKYVKKEKEKSRFICKCKTSWVLYHGKYEVVKLKLTGIWIKTISKTQALQVQ